MPLCPGPFGCRQLASALSRLPGRFETDENEAYLILDHIIESYMRGVFADDEVVVLFGDPPHHRSVKTLPTDALGELENRNLWRADAIMLTFSAAKRYLEASNLAGAPRVLAEWFTDNASPRSSHSREQPQGPSNATREEPKPPIGAACLEAHFRAIKKKKSPVPAQDASVKELAAQYPEKRVTRGSVRAAHKKVFGKLRPGKRSG